MAIRTIDSNHHVVQVQRGTLRRTKRVTGTEAEAKKVEALLTAELVHELKLDEAASLLGVERAPASGAAGAPAKMTLREFFESRWTEHAKVVQNETTRRTSATPWKYLIYYLGDRPLDELLRPSEINAYVEAMKKNGPISFSIRLDGKPRARKCEQLTNATINKGLECLKAALKLAHAEGVIAVPPQIDILPKDDSKTVLPPTEEQFDTLLASSEKFRHVAPLLPEVVEFTAETGLRRGEVFNLTWRSVDLARGAIRVEMQNKGRVVNGVAWRPKHNKWREVPLSARAKAIVEQQRAAAPFASPTDHLFPNKGGCPYVRIEHAPATSGTGYFDLAIADAGLKGEVSFHGLRHLFAVRLLTRGVAITIVSELLGHSDINLTVKRYGRFASDAKVKWEAVKVLDAPEAAPAAPAAQPPIQEQPRRLGVIDGGRRGRDAAL